MHGNDRANWDIVQTCEHLLGLGALPCVNIDPVRVGNGQSGHVDSVVHWRECSFPVLVVRQTDEASDYLVLVTLENASELNCSSSSLWTASASPC